MTQTNRPAPADRSLRRRVRACALAAALLAGATASQALKFDLERVQAAAAAVDTRPVPAQYTPSPLPEGWQHGAFMEIFVRAYQDSDGNGVGDLRGLTQRLDHLKDLGVTGLWLMPILPNADGDHGYATTDYRAIDPAYGTLADFDELIRQAHGRGIGVVMDYVINHSAAQHPLFMDAMLRPQSPWRSWYVFSHDEPRGWNIWDKNPWYWVAAHHWQSKLEPKDLPPAPPGAQDFYFGTFGPHMPDFNLRNPAVVAYHHDSLRFWLNRGLDGFRLDAVPHMVENSHEHWNDQPESRALTRELQALVKRYDRRWTVCEATAEPQQWAAADVCGSAFAFGYTHHYVKAAQAGPQAADSVQALATYWRTAPAGMSTMVSNHDIFAGQRLWDQVGGDPAAYKLAAATYLLQPGTPFIYYGEEVGQAGATGPGMTGDFPIRSPMSWTADAHGAGFTTGRPFRPLAPNRAQQNAQSQAADPGSIFHFYKAMLRVRNSHPSIARGRFEHSFAQGLSLGFQRSWGDERTLVLIHYGLQPATVQVPGLPHGAQLEPVFRQALGAGAGTAPPAAAPAAPAGQRPAATGPLALELPAQSVQVFRVRP